MKKLLVLWIGLGLFSCKKEAQEESVEMSTNLDSRLNPDGIADSLIVEGAFLVILNEDEYKPILADWNESMIWDEKQQEELKSNKILAVKNFASANRFEILDEDIFVYTESGFVVEGQTQEKMLTLLKDSVNVARVYPDFYMQNTRAQMQSGYPLPQNTRAQMQQHPEWGYDVPNYTSKAVLYLGGGIENPTSQNKIWIIDSGIDSTHQDLKGLVNASLSTYFINPISDPKDKNPFHDKWGHGTSCAGLAAASPANIQRPQNDSLIGMTGVSRGAELVSLKVFGEDSVSRFTWVSRAIEYVGQSTGFLRGDVVSMSLGGVVVNCANFGLRSQMIRLTNRGAYIVVAAGNGPGFVGVEAEGYLPACVNGNRIFTIGSMNLDFDTDPFSESFSPFSNFGMPPIDWLTPGNYIFTIYPGNQYAVMQGTSMSAALMAGLIHLTNGVLREKTTVPGINDETYPYPVPYK